MISFCISILFLYFLQKTMKKIKCLYRVEAILCLLFWAYLLFRPELAQKTLIIVCAIYALVSGITWLILAIREIEYEDRLLLGVISVCSAIFGILLLWFPNAWQVVVQILIALLWICIIVKWAFWISDSITAKKLKVKNWYLLIILGCIFILLWAFMAMNGQMTAIALHRLIWLSLIIRWIAMIVWSFRVKKVVKEVKKWLKDVEAIEIEFK